MSNRYLLWMAASALCAAAGTASLDAHAFAVRGSPPACAAADLTGFGGQPRQKSDGSIVNGSTTGAIGIVCPVDDEDFLLPHSAVTSVQVFGRDAVSVAQAGAQACVTFAATGGSACGPQWVSGNSFFGEFTGTPSVSVWQSNPTGRAYLYVVLPQSGNGNSSLRGWIMSG